MKPQKIHKFAAQYMTIGMSFGVVLWLLYANAFLGNPSLGMCIGLPVGMDLGTVTGAVKEYRVTQAQAQEEKFAVCGRAAEEANGRLVSLESKWSRCSGPEAA